MSKNLHRIDYPSCARTNQEDPDDVSNGPTLEGLINLCDVSKTPGLTVNFFSTKIIL